MEIIFVVFYELAYVLYHYFHWNEFHVCVCISSYKAYKSRNNINFTAVNWEYFSKKSRFKFYVRHTFIWCFIVSRVSPMKCGDKCAFLCIFSTCNELFYEYFGHVSPQAICKPEFIDFVYDHVAYRVIHTFGNYIEHK